ncbi:type II and III secretion system protein family protein [Ralstonia nicotianae]|uniref:type II and III secretion system protein family protein n=2 Tax=Ralstonia pseudosolanacearum TaxID=1310165 RepID=UPI0002C134B4|nr:MULTISPECIES: type II and III secretion system protein family protein [Ralstonia]ANH34139.1 secretin [Ralstonia solanacearum]AGH83189.1 Type II/IV secretion system secretin RcpA/CpaC, associated with Flp pilus assembly [Ralstonia pseudosolanacearum FQY_4]MDO3518982.1 type II and III secretion system protein family protein [Ralstonia pseudosolanacearum]MDO3540915.1 type II and III secretion system protein family protein [Ralstonia pseudosolanacearum]QKL52885.1 type II and III secretion syste
MDRFTDHCGKQRRVGPHLRATALAAAALSGLWLGTAHAQAGVESAIVTSNMAAPTKPLRMAANGPIQLTIGSARADTARENTVKGPNCTGPMRDHSEVTVPVGKSTMVQLTEPVRSRTVGNPNIVQAMLVSPQTLYLLGQDVGTTNMIVQGRSGSCSVIDVSVGADPGGLQATLHALMPEASRVRVSAAADSLVLGGTVSDSVQAQKIIDIANAFVMRETRGPAQSGQAGTMGMQGMTAMSTGNAATASSGSGEAVRNPRIINMMSVEAPQQVMLEVKVAEVSKTLINQMGAALNLNGSFGSWTFGALANFLSGAPDIFSADKANKLPFQLRVDAQKGDGLVKVLAEPNLMAISGQEASFLAGGKVYIPVPQSFGTGTTTILLQEETFGVGLRFTPTVLENGRINLKVAPEVSELSPTGVAVTAPNVSGTSILPLITTRRASTTLQVHDGQSFAIGGLIKSNVTGSLKAIPGVGELPVIGALARSTSFQQDQTELLFVVTPHLVKPLPANYPMPTDSFGPVNQGEVYLNGNMEGHPASRPAPAPTQGSFVPEPATPPAATPVVKTVVTVPAATVGPASAIAAPAKPASDPAPAPAAPKAPSAGIAPKDTAIAAAPAPRRLVRVADDSHAGN